jgi:selenocysteine-specific elongation factor
VASDRLSAFEQNIAAEVAAWQEARPNLPGVDVEHLRGACRPRLEARVFRLVLDRMVAAGRLQRSGSVVSTRGHAASLGAADEALARRMSTSIAAAGFMPPVLKDLAAELGVDAARLAKIGAVLVLRDELVKAGADLFFSHAAVGEIRDRLRGHLREHGEITPAGFRDLIAASRKYCIPLLDLFDREGLTIRVGDLRKLRQSQAAAC